MIERLLERIKFKGWTISEFERRIRATTGTVNGWKKRGAIPARRLDETASVLDTSVDYLLGRSSDPTPLSNDQAHNDDDIQMFERAHSRMPEEDRQRLMNMLKAVFGEYFDDDGKKKGGNR